MRNLAVILLAALSALPFGCAPSGEIRSAQQVGEISPPLLRLVQGQTRVERFDPPGAGAVAALTIGTSVFNPNDFPVRLTEIDYTVALEGTQIERDRLELDVLLSPGGTAPLAFEIETSLSDRPVVLREVVQAFGGDPLLFRIDGRITFNSLAYEFRTNRRTLVEGSMLSRESVEAPQMRLAEEESDAYLLNADAPVVRLVLSLSNPGDVGYFLYGKDLRLSLGGHVVASDDLRPVPVPAGSSTRVDIIFYPQRDRLSEEANAVLEAALAGIPTLVELSGSLSMDVLGVDAFTVPDGWKVTGFIHGGER